MGADLTYGWFPVGKRTTVEVSADRDGINLLGAMTDDGETLFLECGGSFTGAVTTHFLEVLTDAFGEELLVVLDQAPYFIANKVREHVADTPTELLYLPAGSPDFNPTEECWHQFTQTLGNQYFADCEELRTAIWPALDSIDSPDIFEYLWP